MKNVHRRICSLLLVLALLLPLLPTAAQPVRAEDLEEASAAIPAEPKAGETDRETDKETDKETEKELKKKEHLLREQVRGAEVPVRGDGSTPALELDTPYEVVIEEPDTVFWLSFTPETSDWYVLRSESDSDTHCMLYDSEYGYLEENDDGGFDYNFQLKYFLEAGETYYYAVRFLFSDMTGSFPVVLSVYEPVTSGFCGDSLFWDYNMETGCLTIAGEGDMYGWDWEDQVPWHEWTPYIRSLSLSDALTSIGGYAFYGCRQLSSVQIPNSVRAIYYRAFTWCESLSSITIPASVTEISPGAFSGCISMTSIGVSSANPNYSARNGVLFNKDRTELIQYPGGKEGSYSVPAGVNQISSWAFGYCYRLSSVTLPADVQSIDSFAFFNCSELESVQLPEELLRIPDSCFAYCYSLAEINIPDSVTSIEGRAFQSCSSLTNVVLPSSVSGVGYDAFACENLESVTVLNRGCNIVFESWTLGNPEYTTIRGGANSTAQAYAEEYGYRFEAIDLCAYGSHNYEITDQLPHTDTEPGWRRWTCTDCGEEYLENTPAGHVFTCVNAESWIGVMQCVYCDLCREEDVSVEIALDQKLAISVDEENPCVWLRFVPNESNYFAAASYGSADTVCTLYNASGDYIDYNDDDGDDGNFYLRACLKAGETYYYRVGCYAGSAGHFEVQISLYEAELSGVCGPNLTWRMDLENAALIIEGSGDMYDFGGKKGFDVSELPWGSFYADIRSISLPAGLSSIGNNAFFAFQNLTEIALPAGLRRIGETAFAHSSISSIEIPDSVTELGEHAFWGCDALESIRFPAGLEEIPEYICHRCYSLNQVVWPTALKRIGDYAFAECIRLAKLELPWTVEEIGERAFAFNFGLTRLTLPLGLKTVRQGAFYSCIDLYGVTIPSSVETIEELAFGYMADAYKSSREIDWDDIIKLEDFTIRGVPGTEAERYAIENEFTFVPIIEFKDVAAKSWYYYAVMWAVENGITTGTGEGNFSPKQTCTRAQVMTFIWHALGDPAPASTENPFTDVKPDKWYTNAVLWAYHNDPQITSGATEDSFGIGNPCTRAQVVTFLWHAAGDPEPETTENPFTDVKPNKWYTKAILWAVENGITSGMGEGIFGTNETCTRAQIVTFLYKALEG